MIRLKSLLTEAMSVSVEEIWGDANGRDQYDFVLAAKDSSGRKVGAVSVSDYRGVPFIKMIEVRPEMRRRGIGMELLRAVQKRYPKHNIKQQGDFATKEGQALWRAWKTK